MNMFRKFVSLLIISLFLIPSLKVNAAPIADLTHKIAGYGAVEGNFYTPTSTQIVNNQLYVLDNFGLSIYNLTNKQLINHFKVDTGINNSSQIWEDPKTWIKFMNSFSKGLLGLTEGLLTGSGLGSFMGASELINVKPDITFDTNGNLYLFSKNGIQQLNLTNGSIIKTLPIPEIDTFKQDEKRRVTYTSKIVNDKIYFLQNISDPENILSASENKIFVQSLDGTLENTIPITFTVKDIIVMPNDFIYLPDLDVFGLIAIDIETMETAMPFQFFDSKGIEVPSSGKSLKIIPSSLGLLAPDKIVTSGMPVSSGLSFGSASSLLVLTIEKNAEDKIEIKQIKKINNKSFGMSSIDLSCSNNGISLITSGMMDSPVWDSRVFYIHEDNAVERIGTSFYSKGQIFGSIAYATDKDGNLYETSFTNSLINKYDKNGTYLSSIEMDLKVISSLMGLLTIYPTVLDMTIEGDYLYLSNLLPGSINRYSFSENAWEQIYTESPEKIMESMPLWFNIKIESETLFLLDSAILNEGAPNLSFINEDSENIQINLQDTPSFDEVDQPLFTGFNLTESQYQFLDCIHQEIWLYDRLSKSYIKKIELPKNPKGFYTSFDIYPDDSWIVTDVISCELLHVSNKGELIESIGKKGSVNIGKTKETYQEIKDQFNKPIRAKISNKTIYVSDLLNCRYHIIPLEVQPEIKWEKDALNISNFSVFNEEIFDINFSINTNKEIAFKLSITEPWMQIKSELGNTSDQKISIKILGEKLVPWKTSIGRIQVNFPTNPELNKVISVTVEAVGNIVKITIGSDKASINGKDISIDKASVPTIVKGRTFVGVRFMGEIVFNNLATINFDSKTQTVFYKLGSKKIELYIGKPYAIVNGNKVKLDIPPFIQKGRTFVPLRFVSENLDASVVYDANIQTITITYPAK